MTLSADMWSIGAIFYEMLTGQILFEGKHPVLRAVEICGPIPDIVLDEVWLIGYLARFAASKKVI